MLMRLWGRKEEDKDCVKFVLILGKSSFAKLGKEDREGNLTKCPL